MLLSPFVRPSVKLLGVAMLVTLSACATVQATGPVTALPQGYYLQPDKAYHTLLADRSGHRALQGTVAAYSVFKLLVFGAEGNPPTGIAGSYAVDQPFSGSADTRYFILDTESGKLEQHLDARSWHKRLQKLGVPADFRLYPPLRWRSL